MKKYSGPALKWKILSRTLKLFVLGCLTQGCNIWLGGDGINMSQLRIPGSHASGCAGWCLSLSDQTAWLCI